MRVLSHRVLGPPPPPAPTPPAPPPRAQAGGPCCTIPHRERPGHKVWWPPPSPVSHSYRGPCHLTSPGALSMKVEMSSRAPSLVKPFSPTKLHTQVLRTLHGSGLVCLLQASLLVVLYARRYGVGGVFLPWGKGLIVVI